jgi:hypothetical protein
LLFLKTPASCRRFVFVPVWMSGMRYLGMFRHEPWALFITVKTRVGGAGGDEDMSAARLSR